MDDQVALNRSEQDNVLVKVWVKSENTLLT